MTDIQQVMKLSFEAFLAYNETTYVERANFLNQIASEIENLGDELIHAAMEETNLPEVRFQGERSRTCNQLRAFGELLVEGSWVNAVIETADDNRIPLPKPDMRKVDIAIGPVVVFGASNFPLAYSTAGGDTASALAAGCSVVVKGHPSHPKTSRLVAGAITKAVEKCKMHPHTFQHVEGSSFDIGRSLVQDPYTAAVGFTGSLKGGRAIFDYGQQRVNPIPVFAEMGSSNPVIILPEILKNDSSSLAKKLSNSIAMGVGQFCTNPGIILLVEGMDAIRFGNELSDHLSQTPSFKMLNDGIHRNYLGRINDLLSVDKLKVLFKGSDNTDQKAPPMVALCDSATMKSHPTLHDEVFGPSTIIVLCKDINDLTSVWKLMHGQLTTTIYGTDEEILANAFLIEMAKHMAGRVVFNGVPTGVEVNPATVHGGPYPASTDSRFTSVGMDAIKRWVRPVCFQDCPNGLLPPSLQNENPTGILRKVNGLYHRDAIN